MDHHQLFAKLKPLCTALLKPPLSADTLTAIVQTLRDAPPTAFTQPLIEYTFFPLSHILRQNQIATLSNHVIEQIFLALAQLAEHWHCAPEVWEQLVMLSSAVLAGLDKATRDEETYLAAALALRALIRPATDTERFIPLVQRAQSPRTLPIIGKSLDALLGHTSSPNHTLQITCLSVLLVLVRDYFPEDDVPAILPGVVSTTSRIALSPKITAPAIQLALQTLTHAVQRAISDDVCILHGALHDIRSLDDLISTPSTKEQEPNSGPVPKVHRTASWLSGTASQLHIALNTLSPLVSHPNPIARLAVVELCSRVAESCPRTLEKTQPLVLSHLLTLAYPALSAHPPEDASKALHSLRSLVLSPQTLQTITSLTSRTLSLLPHRLTPTHQPTASSLARQLVSACEVLPHGSIGALLGPSGGVQKWGRTLLGVLRFESRGVVVLGDVQGLLTTSKPGDDATTKPGEEKTEPYPPLTLRSLDPETHAHVESVFLAMGSAAGDEGVFAIEWFVGVGSSSGDDEIRVAALWCALMLLRGVLRGGEANPSSRVVKAAKWIGKSVSEMWDDRFEVPEFQGSSSGAGGGGEEKTEVLELTEYVKGLNPLTTLLDRGEPTPTRPRVNWKRRKEVQTQHTSLSIQLLTASHIALSSSSTTSLHMSNPYTSTLSTNPSVTLLQYTLYPLLVSLLSPAAVLASTAHTALVQVSDALGYAAVSNMLLANFDYALEGVARRVSVFSTYAASTTLPPSSPSTPATSTSVSIQALQVLRSLIHLIGRAIIDRATDVLDECFDRLDDFHGYSAVVQALVDVLAEVVVAVGREDEGNAREGEKEDVWVGSADEGRWEAFVGWFKKKGEKVEDGWEFDLKDKDGDSKGKGKEDEELEPSQPDLNPDEPPPLPPSQSLTRQIIARSTYFLTHPSPHIRAQILHLLATAAPTLRASALMPTIHASWPFILNRLGDKEPFVVLSAARLVEELVRSVGDFMARRVWEDIWPRFEKMLKTHAETSLVRTGRRAQPGPGLAKGGYEEYGPRALSDLHLSILHTLAGAAEHVEPSDEAVWNVLLACRRFLAGNPKSAPARGDIRRNEWGEREDVQKAARELYVAVGKHNPDAVWLVLVGTCGDDPRVEGGQAELPAFLQSDEWDVKENVASVLNEID